MTDDGSIAPGAARVALAHRAGLRARSPWLAPAVLCLGLWAALPEALGEDTRAALRAALAGGDLRGLVDMFFRAWLSVLAGAGALVLAALAVTGSLGWVSAAPESERFGRVRRGVGPLLLGAAALAVCAAVLRGALAGAARSVDASPAGLSLLWWSWAHRGLGVLGGASLVAAAIDLALARRALWRALHLTPAQARERGRA